MPIFRIEARERFVVRTVYYAEASTPGDAIEACRSGSVAYHESHNEEGDEQWLGVSSVSEVDEMPE